MKLELLYQANAQVRQLLYNSDNNQLIIETKSANTVVSFLTYDLKTQQIAPISYTNNHRTWEVAAYDVHRNSLLLRHYLDERNANQTALELYDTKQNISLGYWEMIRIEHCNKEWIYVSSTHSMEKKFYRIHRQNANIEPTTTDQAISQAPPISDFQSPTYYPEGTAHFATCKTFLESYAQVQPLEGVYYLAYRRYIVLEGIVQEKDTFFTTLWIFDTQGTLLGSWKTARTSLFLGSSSFFVVRDWLFRLDKQHNLWGSRLTN